MDSCSVTVAGNVQRRRVLDAMVSVVGARGFADTTVTLVCAQARVSRATFYQVFDGLDDCFLAVIDDGYTRARGVIAAAFEREATWRDGVRAALVALLTLFSGEPVLARVWFVETLAAGVWALERRQRHVEALTSMIVQWWPSPEGAQANPLAASAVMQSVLGVLHTHLLTGTSEPLLDLLSPLMGQIVALYLGPRAAAGEIARCEALTHQILSESSPQPEPPGTREVQIPGSLQDARAHRARACLLCLSRNSGASNRQIARAVGIARDDQVSTMLGRLARMGLLVKEQGRPGGPNSWSLSPYGQLVAHALRDPSDPDQFEVSDTPLDK
jgi:AcrR family transcriptional regulator